MMMNVVVMPLRKLQKRLRKINSDNEIGQLADDIGELAEEMDAYMAQIESVTSENTRTGINKQYKREDSYTPSGTLSLTFGRSGTKL